MQPNVAFDGGIFCKQHGKLAKADAEYNGRSGRIEPF